MYIRKYLQRSDYTNIENNEFVSAYYKHMMCYSCYSWGYFNSIYHSWTRRTQLNNYSPHTWRWDHPKNNLCHRNLHLNANGIHLKQSRFDSQQIKQSTLQTNNNEKQQQSYNQCCRQFLRQSLLFSPFISFIIYIVYT